MKWSEAFESVVSWLCAVPLWLISLPISLSSVAIGYLYGVGKHAFDHGYRTSPAGKEDYARAQAMVAEVMKMYPNAKTNMPPPGTMQ